MAPEKRVGDRVTNQGSSSAPLLGAAWKLKMEGEIKFSLWLMLHSRLLPTAPPVGMGSRTSRCLIPLRSGSGSHAQLFFVNVHLPSKSGKGSLVRNRVQAPCFICQCQRRFPIHIEVLGGGSIRVEAW